MTQKIHGFVAAGQHLTGGLSMFSVAVANYDLTVADAEYKNEDGDMVATHNIGLEKIIEALSTRAQPVVIGQIAAGGFNFAVEHVDVFADPKLPEASVSAYLATFSAFVQDIVRKATGSTTATVAITAMAF